MGEGPGGGSAKGGWRLTVAKSGVEGREGLDDWFVGLNCKLEIKREAPLYVSRSEAQ